MSAENLKVKQQAVDEFTEKVKKAKAFVLVDYRGLNVAEDTAMRVELRKAGVEYKVVKNTFVERAMDNAGIKAFDGKLSGPTAIAISYEDEIAPAKIVVGNVKKTGKITVKGGFVDGRTLDAAGVAQVATIPQKNVLIAQFLGLLQSPIRNLAVVLAEAAKKKAE